MSLRQSATDSPRQRSTEPERRALCWHRERDLPCLRVEPTPEQTFLFPYQLFLGAHHTRQHEAETLVISFSTHEVTVSGRELREIASALQELAVDWIKAVPARYGRLAGTDSTWITKIDMKAVE